VHNGFFFFCLNVVWPVVGWPGGGGATRLYECGFDIGRTLAEAVLTRV
jgi:hypothetical protein